MQLFAATKAYHQIVFVGELLSGHSLGVGRCSRFIRARKRAAYRGLIGQIAFWKTRRSNKNE
jgi:hypothetical protein